VATQAVDSTPNNRAKRRELVARAASLFNDVGYHNTSVEDVAEACGIRKPTLYHYFKSKHEILFWIHDELIDVLIARQESRVPLDLPARQALLEIMGDVLDLMDTHPGYVRVFFEHYRELSDEHRAAIRAKRNRYERSIREILQQGIDAGELRPMDVRIATLTLAGMCNWAYQWYEPGGPLTSREVAYVFWDILVRGLRTPAP
jgi:AcrR family transcriptional regulator